MIEEGPLLGLWFQVMKEFEGEESEEKKEGDAAADALADQVAETKVGEEEKAE